MTKRFRTDNTEGYTDDDLAELNTAFDLIVEDNRNGGADWDAESAQEASWQDHIAEELLTAYDAGRRGEELLTVNADVTYHIDNTEGNTSDIDTADTEAETTLRLDYRLTVVLSGPESLMADTAAIGATVHGNVDDLLQRVGIGEGLISTRIDVDESRVGAESVTLDGPNPATFVIVEMADIELIDVLVIADEEEARATFQRIADAGRLVVYGDEEDMRNEAEGTLAVAGDDVHSVQLLRRCAFSLTSPPEPAIVAPVNNDNPTESTE